MEEYVCFVTYSKPQASLLSALHHSESHHHVAEETEFLYATFTRTVVEKFEQALSQIIASEMSLKIYFDLMSPPARSVLLFCKLNKIPFTPQPIALRKLEQKSEEFTKINPFQRVPAIVDGDLKLSESKAILQYLAVKYNTPDHWLPKDPARRAKVQEFSHWYDEALRQYGMAIVLESANLFISKGKEPNAKLLDKLWSGINKGLDNVENVFLKDNPYLAGNEISLADIIGGCEVMHLTAQSVDFTSSRPKMTDWLKRIRNDTNPEFDEVHSIVYKLAMIDKPRL